MLKATEVANTLKNRSKKLKSSKWIYVHIISTVQESLEF